jgi:hypothetical protein
MTPEPDWADAWAWAIVETTPHWDLEEYITPVIAAALRKAKADGMREAAEMCDKSRNHHEAEWCRSNDDWDLGARDCSRDAAINFRARADQIEKGTS